MDAKLESPEVEVELDSQAPEEEQTTKEIEQEIYLSLGYKKQSFFIK